MFRASLCSSSGEHLSRRVLPLILMDTYVGVSCFDLHVLLNQMAAVVLCGLRLRFLKSKISFACLALANVRFMWPCIIIVECKCFVKRSLESSSWPRYLIGGLQGMTVCWNWSGGGVAGRRLVNNIATLLLMFTRSFHLVKYLCSKNMAWVSRRAMVSVCQDWARRAVSSAYSANWVLGGCDMSEM